MVPVPHERFASALRDLDGPAFATLVADLWSRTGWETERDGQVVLATRRDRTRRLYVVPPRRSSAVPLRRLSRLRGSPDVPADADAVVTARRGDDAEALPAAQSQDVVDADDLRERALYALEPPERSAFFERHLGISADSDRWDDDSSATAAIGSSVSAALPASLPVDAARSPAVRALGVVALAIVALVAVQALAIGPAAFGDDVSTNQSSSSDGVSAASPDDESSDDPSGAVPAAYDVEPTCERSPAEVARVLSDAFEAGDTAHTLHTYWDFANPEFKTATSYRRYASLHRSAFEGVIGAESIELEEPVQVEGGVRVNATVSHQRTEAESWYYVLEHREEPPREGCWVVNSFSQA